MPCSLGIDTTEGTPMYDVIVVGARCAGAPTAMLLAGRGYRVLLVDRTAFPSDTLSTHFIHQTGNARLGRWGLLPRIAATNCPPITSMTFDPGPFTLQGWPPPAEGIVEAYAPRRTALDGILAEAAVEAGAELREHFTVSDLLTDGDRVSGVRGRSAGGASVAEAARVVVGADGMRSLVARCVRAPTYAARPGLTCAYYTYWAGVPVDGVELYVRPGQFIIAFPTNDSRVCIVISWPAAAFPAVRADVEGQYLRALEQAPALAARVRAGQRVAHFRGTADLPNFYRQPHGPGWALVGDAGHHKDPITGQGISDAFRDAELLAAALDAGFSQRQPLDAALADYERERNAATRAHYDLTCQLATLEPPSPEMQQLFAALRGNQPETDRLFGTFAGIVPVAEFFAPENVQRIVAAARDDKAGTR
jgi:2-polyprenyl-6-methoxyphenol hydroxylase-like FAD-dependent oxidoreductase